MRVTPTREGNGVEADSEKDGVRVGHGKRWKMTLLCGSSASASQRRKKGGRRLGH